jgi:hypothetical protein
MPILNQSQRENLKTFVLGQQVSKSAAVLPATTTQNIFTIAGGRVLVTALIGEVTTICSATAANLKVTSAPTTGTAADIAANLAVANLEAGTILVVEGDATAVIGVSAGHAPALNALPFILPIGTLRIETSGTNTGATKWDLFYVPIDDGAVVTSA